MTRLGIAAALAFSLAACSRAAPRDAAARDAAAQPAPPSGTAALPAAAFVSAATALRREPTDAARVPGPHRKQVPNALAVLQRGERLTVLEAREDWAKVRASDDTVGWVSRASVLEGEGIVEATVLAPADVFDRPDLLAANARRKVEAGTLLLVVRARAPFAEVNVSSGPNAWVLAERLASGEQDVSAAKLVEKARWLERGGHDEDAKRILALARDQYPGSPIVDALAIELGEAQPPGGEVVPANATAPATPAAPGP